MRADGINNRKLRQSFKPLKNTLTPKEKRDVSGHQEDQVVILATNDIHANIFDPKSRTGLAFLATAIREERDKYGDVLLLDAGDSISAGDPIVQFMKGFPVIEIMNRLGYDATTIGNHEFDYGTKRLRDLIKLAKFPVLSSNVILEGAHLKPYIIKEVNGHKIGILGVTTDQMLGMAPSDKLKGATILREEVIGKYIKELKKRDVDLIVLLSHSSHDSDLSRDVELAKKFPDIDLIIAGHSHDILERPLKVGRTLIVEGGKSAKRLMEIIVKFSEKRKHEITYKLLKSSHYKPAKDIVNFLSSLRRSRSGKPLEEKLGVNPVYLWKSNYEQSPLGTLITESMLKSAPHADAALVTSGSIRDELKPGPLTYGDIYKVLPFEKNLYYVTLKGKHLKELLELGLKDRKLSKDTGSDFIQQSGLKVVWTLKENAPKVLEIYKARTGELVRDEDEVKVVVSTILADVLSEKYGAKRVPVGKDETEAWISYMRELLSSPSELEHIAKNYNNDRYIFRKPNNHS